MSSMSRFVAMMLVVGSSFGVTLGFLVPVDTIFGRQGGASFDWYCLNQAWECNPEAANNGCQSVFGSNWYFVGSGMCGAAEQPCYDHDKVWCKEQ